MRTKLKVALIFMLVSLFLLPGSSFAANNEKDNKPPKLKNFIIYPTEINIGEEVFIGVKAKDKKSDVVYAGVMVDSPSGQILRLDLDNPKKPSGNGWWTTSYTPNEGGIWRLLYIGLIDGKENLVVYYDFPDEESYFRVNVPVKGISLNKRYITIKLEESKEVNAIINPINSTNKSVKWSSDNLKVASIDENGVITGVGYGRALITATTEDGSFKASSEVVVASYNMPNYEYLRETNSKTGIPSFNNTEKQTKIRYYNKN